MSFIFKKDINNKEIVFEIVPKAHTPNKLIVTNKYRGYECSLFKINGREVKNSSVKCYLETHQKTGPVLFLKGESLALLEKVCETNFDKDFLYIEIPALYKDEYIQILNNINLIQEEEERKIREQNDLNIKEDDIIYIIKSQFYITVTYPFESNRSTVESKQLTEAINYDELDSWIENALSPFYLGKGCGGAQKFKMSYKDYKNFLNEYLLKLSRVSL